MFGAEDNSRSNAAFNSGTIESSALLDATFTSPATIDTTQPQAMPRVYEMLQAEGFADVLQSKVAALIEARQLQKGETAELVIRTPIVDTLSTASLQQEFDLVFSRSAFAKDYQIIRMNGTTEDKKEPILIVTITRVTEAPPVPIVTLPEPETVVATPIVEESVLNIAAEQQTSEQPKTLEVKDPAVLEEAHREAKVGFYRARKVAEVKAAAQIAVDAGLAVVTINRESQIILEDLLIASTALKSAFDADALSLTDIIPLIAQVTSNYGLRQKVTTEFLEVLKIRAMTDVATAEELVSSLNPTVFETRTQRNIATDLLERAQAVIDRIINRDTVIKDEISIYVSMNYGTLNEQQRQGGALEIAFKFIKGEITEEEFKAANLPGSFIESISDLKKKVNLGQI